MKALRLAFRKLRRYDGMSCNDCGRWEADFIDFLVATPIWNYVMAGQQQTTLTVREGLFEGTLRPRVQGIGGVVCLRCFDRRAARLGIEYRDHLVVLGGGCWMGGNFTGPVPL